MIVCADARRVPLADESVQCIVTSPPYWGLRSYAGNQELTWGGVASCEHEWAEWTEHIGTGGSTAKQASNRGANGDGHERRCGRCGAWRGSFGLEPTVQLYVDHSVDILRECRRVLRADGVLFWNIGDCYATGAGKVGECPGGGEQGARWSGFRGTNPTKNAERGIGPIQQPNRMPQAGLKSKDLVLMPARVALAAQADGWWIRSDIIWAKPNPMPESVQDRPTDAYEHILMLTKSARYFWDSEAVAEPCASGPSDVRKMLESLPRIGGKHKELVDPLSKASSTTNIGVKRSVGGVRIHGNVPGRDDGGRACNDPEQLWRNLRNVWTLATKSYSGAHFATFPEEIPRICIKAASKVGDLVLDPFGGSGTTGRVAIELRRRIVLIDLAYNHDYGPLAKARTSRVQLEAFA